MSSNTMSDCCISGVKHEGESVGEYKDIAGIKTYLSYPPDKKTDIAVLYLCDAFGHELVNNRLLGDSMAKAGYFVVMPDLFDGEPIPPDAFEKGFEFPPWLSRHPVKRVDSIVEDTIKEMREKYGVKKIGAVGYCFGGRYVVRFLAKGKGLDAGFAAHPSLVGSNEFDAVTGPLSLAFAETDQVMPPEKRSETEAILQKNGILYETHLYGGVAHGFAVRADLSIPTNKYAKETAYHQAITWFNQWLKNRPSEKL